MNAYSVKFLKHNSKNIELAAYVLLASGFIGHIFFLENQVSAMNIALIAIGIVFGVMASVNWTPLTQRMSQPVRFELAEVFSFARPEKSGSHHNPGDQRAA